MHVREREDEKEERVTSSLQDNPRHPGAFLMLLVLSLLHPPTRVPEASSLESLIGPEHKHFPEGGLAVLCEGFLPPRHGLQDQSPQTQMVSVNRNQRDTNNTLG